MKRGHDYPGLLISFEGGEGSGKSTQIKLLQEYLSQQGYVISRGRCSGGTPIGERIREILQNPKIEDLNERTELLLFIGSRAESVAKIVLPTLKSGGICLHDRFRESSIAYQGHGLGLDLAMINLLNDFATNNIKSDIVFFFDNDPEAGLKNTSTKEFGEKDKIEKRELSFHERVREGYIKMAQEEPDRIKVIPFQKDKIGEMQNQIRKAVDKYIAHFQLRDKLIRANP